MLSPGRRSRGRESKGGAFGERNKVTSAVRVRFRYRSADPDSHVTVDAGIPAPAAVAVVGVKPAAPEAEAPKAVVEVSAAKVAAGEMGVSSAPAAAASGKAMAAGKAVISTSIGAEGLDVRNGRDIVLADSAKSFSSAVSSLLRDSIRREQYERAAAETAARFDWSVIGEKFGRTLAMVREPSFAAAEAAYAGVQVKTCRR